MQAGTLPWKDFIIDGEFNDQLFVEIWEKKLANLLATEVMENEEMWLNYDFEESQIKIDLGDIILEHLITESIKIMNLVDDNKSKEWSLYASNSFFDQFRVFIDEDINEILS